MRRSVLTSALLLVAGAGCQARPAPGAAPAAARLADSAFVALVGPAEARFVFPVQAPRDWRWPRDSAADPNARYAWGVTVLTGDTAYLVGAAVWRREHAAELASLEEAVRAARPRLYSIEPGGHLQVAVPGADVRAAVEGSRVVVTLRGAAMVSRVFRARPRRVRFGVLAPAEPRWWTDSTDVEYRAR